MKHSPLKRGTKKLKTKKRMSRVPEATGMAFWKKRSKECRDRARGRCEWVFWIVPDLYKRCPSDASDAAHIVPLGMGRSRHEDTLHNALDGLLALCRKHHVAFDSMPHDDRATLALEMMRCRAAS